MRGAASGSGGLGTGGGGLPSPTSHPARKRRARHQRRPPFPDLPCAAATSLPRWRRAAGGGHGDGLQRRIRRHRPREGRIRRPTEELGVR
ncbi:hypothetical protein OsJ_17620 [Oryza sativa Japonica Group]|uniref:Uncharacterized protein n=1 Tax=Oryza sativa subsp. japonica TaxID=39947 RepID=B9FN73_ORYSJ|nr:hypothetical protein OsJ_17620 [Oryza sativa Japonica Group]